MARHPPRPRRTRGRGFTEDEILCSTAAPVSFASPRGKFVVHCLRDRFALESTTPKGTTTHVVRHEHVRRLLCLRRGDSNDTTDVVVALSPAAALAVGKQSVKTLLAQCRGKDKPVEIVTRRDMGLDPRLSRAGSPPGTAPRGATRVRLWWRCWRWPPESPPRRKAAPRLAGNERGSPASAAAGA